MKKKVFCMVLTIVTVLSFMTTAFARTSYVVGCKECVSLRTSPSTSAKKIVDVPLYSMINTLSYSGSFTKVTYDGKTGWILSKYIDDGGFEPQIVTYPTNVIKCKEFISLRGAANTGSNVIARIPLGATVYRTTVSNRNGFSLIVYNGNIGWAMSKYLR